MAQSKYVEKAGLKIARPIHALLAEKFISQLQLDEAKFFDGFAQIIEDFSGRQNELLAIDLPPARVAEMS